MKEPKSSSSRPKIWAEGRQHPPFDLRAFAKASLIYGRDGMAGLLSRCAGSATDVGKEIAAGRWRIPEHRLGRIGRYLPGYNRVAETVLGGAEVLQSSARVIQPAIEAAPEPAPVAHVVKPQPVHRKHDTAAPAPEALEDPDLARIRALILSAPAPEAAPQRKTAVRKPVPETPQDAPPRKNLLKDGASVVLGWGLLAVSLPYGAGKALYAYLSGEDLRTLDEPG